MTTFRRIDPDLIPPKALSYLEDAIKKNPLPEDPTIWDILEDARNGEGEIYAVISEDIIGAMYLEIYPNILNVALLGGDDLKYWKEDLADFLKKILKDRGIKHLSVVGRYGWNKLFPDLKPIGTFYLL